MGQHYRKPLKSGYKGVFFPINPKHEEIQGHKAYASLFQVSLAC